MEQYQIQQRVHIDFAYQEFPPRVYAKQYDNGTRVVAVDLYENGQPYTVPTGYSVNIRLDKQDGHHVYNPVVLGSGNIVLAVLTQQMLTHPGELPAEIEVVREENVLKTATFTVVCAPSAVPNKAIQSSDEYKTVQEIEKLVRESAQIVVDNLDAIHAIPGQMADIQGLVDQAEAAKTAAEESRDEAAQSATEAILKAAQAAAEAAKAADAAGDAETSKNEAKKFAEMASQISNGCKGWYPNLAALEAAFPPGEDREDGEWALLGDTDSIWVWDSDTGEWKDSRHGLGVGNVWMDGGATIILEGSFAAAEHTIKINDDLPQATDVGYDNAESGLEAVTMQEAIDEVYAKWQGVVPAIIIKDIQDAASAAVALAVEQAKDAILSGGIPYGKEIAENWTDLRGRIQTGDMWGLHIGDYKTITLTTGEVVVMEASGMDHYYKCGHPTMIGHHVDFISRDCLAGTKLFNDTNTNNGTAAEPNPWRASKLFQTLNDEVTGVFATLPADLKPLIIPKTAMLERRYSEAGALEASTGWDWNNMGKLWLPTEVEVFGNMFWSDGDAGWTGGGGCNLQYPIFYGGAKHIIKGAGNGGPRCHWWEASARRKSSSYVCFVSGDGNADGYVATRGGVYVPLCFRIG